MTPQKQEQTNPMFHYFQMEDLVPDLTVDFSFVRDVVSGTMADPVLILN